MSCREVGREGLFGKRKPVGDLAADGNLRKAGYGERPHNQVAEPETEAASGR
jgi:hypothetical protein